MTPAQKRAKAKYDKEYTVQVRMKLNIKTDQDIIEAINNSGNKQVVLDSLVYCQRLVRMLL